MRIIAGIIFSIGWALMTGDIIDSGIRAEHIHLEYVLGGIGGGLTMMIMWVK